MERKANRMLARKLANKLLKDCEVIAPPVKLYSLVNHLDILVVKGIPNFLNKDKISAFIELEERILAYNDDLPTVRQRFSVAHEIGHLILEHHVENDIYNLDSNDFREIEANMFAAELLIPYDWIKKDMSGLKLSIKDLAQKYWVSEESMGWRLFKSDALLLTK